MRDRQAQVERPAIRQKPEIDIMREAGRIVATVFEEIAQRVKPGVTTGELDAYGHRVITRMGARPSFLHYHDYPASLCISVNEQVVHGIPGTRVLKSGDIVAIDVGAYYKGYHGDAARTYAVGDIAPETADLIHHTQLAFEAGLAMAQPGNRVGDISHAVQEHAEKHGYGVVRELVGHGVGQKLHEEPNVPNFGRAGKGVILQPGMVIAIEPMINLGTHRVYTLDDDWTVVTADGKPSAHYENTVWISPEGPVCLTVL